MVPICAVERYYFISNIQNNKIIGLSIFIFLDVITSKINSKIIYNLNDIFGNIFNFPKKYFRYYY